MRLKVQNLCYWHPPWLPDTPGKSQMFLKIKSSIFFLSHLNSRSGTVGTKELWISFHSLDIFFAQNKAWKSSQNREALEGIVPFKVFGFDSQILSSHIRCPDSELPRKRPKRRRVGFKGKRSIYLLFCFKMFLKQFQLSLGKIDAMSSDCSLNGLCGLRSVECLWVIWCKLMCLEVQHRVTWGKAEKLHRFTDML